MNFQVKPGRSQIIDQRTKNKDSKMPKPDRYELVDLEENGDNKLLWLRCFGCGEHQSLY